MWLTIECERALYVDRGRDVILCDRLPSPITLVVKLASGIETEGHDRAARRGAKHESPTAESGDAKDIGGPSQ